MCSVVRTSDSVLSDPVRRERYDVFGVDNSDDEYEGDEPEEEGEYLSPEDVFSMFLGIPPGARVQRRHYSTPTNVSRAESHLFTLLQLLPALVLLCMAVAPPPSASAAADPHDTPFRVEQDATHSVERRTAAARVPFYVRPDFEGVVVDGDAEVLRRVEEAVEVLEKARLKTECAAEQKQQQKHVDVARRRPKGPERDELLEKALAFAMPHCKALDGFGKRSGGGGREAAGAA